MSTRFLEANNIKIYAVLSDFAKCRDSRVKKCSASAQNRGGGGGVQPIRAMPIFRLLFLKYGFPKNPIPVLVIPGSFMEFPGSLHALGFDC